jgi:hypothetical protein
VTEAIKAQVRSRAAQRRRILAGIHELLDARDDEGLVLGVGDAER